MNDVGRRLNHEHEIALEPLHGRMCLAILVWGAVVAPIAAGLAIGTAVVVGGEVLFDLFVFPRGANAELAILFVLALIAVLLVGTLFMVSVKR